MDLVYALPAGTPQLSFDHPRSHRLPPYMNIVLAGQVLRRQRRPEAAIDFAAEYLQRLLLGGFVQLPIRLTAAQGVNQGTVAFALHALQQPPNMPLALPDLLGGLFLRNQSFLGFFQGDQPVAVSLRHEKYS
jgi:hypothetical protein